MVWAPKGPILAAVLGLAATAWGAEDFLGAAACAECHRGEYEKQASSRHARALRPIRATPLPELLMDRPLRERGGISFDYQVVDTGLAVTVRRDQQEVSAILEWAFGTGAQGFTPVGRFEGRYFEHRISYYAEPARPGITMGHPVKPPAAARAALGQMQATETIYRCFHCHATGVKQGAAGPDLSAMRPGIECERCHGPGRGHVEAARAGTPAVQLAKTVLNPGRFPAKALVEICGECHRTPALGRVSPTPEIEDPVSVRFQPVGFLASKCFSAGKNFSCVTCHDPHEDARRDDAFYTAKCLECHRGVARVKAECKRAARQNCLPCHMRRTEPVPYLHFTDHRIRVY